MSALSLILIFGVLAGQLIKIPPGPQGGLILLDLAVFTIDLVGIGILRFRLKNPPNFIKAALIFILICILSLIFTPLKLEAFELATSFLYTVRLASYILLGWIIYSGAFRINLSQIKEILIASGVGLAILGLIQFIFLPDLSFLNGGWDTHYFRTVSTFLDPNFAGAFFALTLLLLTQRLRQPFSQQIPIILMFTTSYLALLTTYSRSSYGMFLAIFITLAMLKKSLKLFLIGAGLFSILLLGFYLYTIAIATPRGIDREQSAKFRLGSWERGAYMFSHSPLLGIGYNSYRFGLKEYNLAPDNLVFGRGGSGNDSSLLHIAATTGTVGFFSFVVFLYTLSLQGWRNFKSNKSTGVILIAVLPGLLAHSFFANSLFYPPILLWLILVASKENE